MEVEFRGPGSPGRIWERMMNMKRIRSLSLVLVLTLVLGLLPMRASAVYCIDLLQCIVETPLAGQPLKNNCQVPDEDQESYTVQLVSWYVGDDWETVVPVDVGEPADPGKRYWVQVEFTPKAGYMLMEDTEAIINRDIPDVVEYIDAGTVRAVRAMSMRYWGIGRAPLEVTQPYVGETPRYLVNYPETDRYSVTDLDWKKGTDWNHLLYVDPGEVFAAGETYWAIATIEPGANYIVGDPTAVTINGKALDPHSSRSPYNHNYYAVCTFTALERQDVTHVSLSIDEPQAGDQLYYRIRTSEPEKYNAFVGDWYQGTQWETAQVLRDEDHYQGGQDYWIRAVAFPEPGHVFAPDPTGRPTGMTMEINGIPAEQLAFNEQGYLTGAVRLRCPSVPGYVIYLDVPVNAYYAEAVEWAVENDVTSGTGPTTFSPDASCTRAQAMTFLWKAQGAPEPGRPQKAFGDVPENAYYAKSVFWALENGITSGFSADTFGSDVVCTRAQIVCFLWNAAGRPSAAVSNPFRDVPQGAYYEQAVLWAVENGITTGLSDDTFGPNEPCTRGQIVCFLYKAMQ